MNSIAFGLYRDKEDGEIVLLISDQKINGDYVGCSLLRSNFLLDWVRTDVVETYYERLEINE